MTRRSKHKSANTRGAIRESAKDPLLSANDPVSEKSVVNWCAGRWKFGIWFLDFCARMCSVARMDNYNWAKTFGDHFADALDAYRAGKRDADSMFNPAVREFFKSIGATPQEIFDFVEDTFYGGEPGMETALLVTAVRRDYFLVVQKGQLSDRVIDMDALPSKSAELAGIEWLPRIIEKAKAKLRGEMPPDLMYVCGGDRAFLREHNIHPADFLREVWAAGNDLARIVDYVKLAAADKPANVTGPVCQILPGGRVKC
jgi:hypothetical protein